MEGFDIEIPDNADKILFAEDFMNNFLTEARIVIEVYDTVGEYREFIHNAFDDTMRNAVRFLMNQLLLSNMQLGALFMHYPMGIKIYQSLATYLQQRYLSEGFMPRKFLFYCVHVANLAVIFLIAGYPKAPSSGLKCILDVIQGYDMSSDGWDALHLTTSTYEKMHKKYDNSLRFSGINDYTYKPGLSESKIAEIFMVQLLDLDDFVISITEWEEELMSAQIKVSEARIQELRSEPKLERKLFQDISTSEPRTSVSEESGSMELLDNVLEESSDEKKRNFIMF